MESYRSKDSTPSKVENIMKQMLRYCTSKFSTGRVAVLFLLGALIIYNVYIYFAHPAFFYGDIFEYMYHADNLIHTGDVTMLTEFQGGVSGSWDFPIYAVFPGLFFILAQFSIITGIPIAFAAFLLEMLFIVCFNLVLYIFLKTTSQYFKVRNPVWALLLILLFVNLTQEYGRFLLSTKNVNYFFTFCVLVIFFRYLSDKSPLKQVVRIAFLGVLFYPFIHHQSTIVIIAIYLAISLYLILTKRVPELLADKSNIVMILISTFVVLGHFLFFILPHLNALVNIGEEFFVGASGLAEKASFRIDTTVIAMFVPIGFLLVGISGKQLRRYLPLFLILILLLVGYYQQYIFGTTLYPHRFAVPFTLLSTAFYIVILQNPNKFLRTTFYAYLVVTALSGVQGNITLTREGSVIDNGYVFNALTLRRSQELPRNARIFTDPVSGFMTLKLLGVDQSYSYLRPIANIDKYYYERIEQMKIFTKPDYGEIYSALVDNGYTHVLFDEKLSAEWSGGGEDVNVPLWQSLDAYPGFNKVTSYRYSSLNREVAVYLYSVE